MPRRRGALHHLRPRRAPQNPHASRRSKSPTPPAATSTTKQYATPDRQRTQSPGFRFPPAPGIHPVQREAAKTHVQKATNPSAWDDPQHTVPHRWGPFSTYNPPRGGTPLHPRAASLQLATSTPTPSNPLSSAEKWLNTRTLVGPTNHRR